MDSSSQHAPSDWDQDFIDKVLALHATRPGGLLAVLQQVQSNHPRKYLPRGALEYISAKTGIPAARIYSVVTFYALFNLEPQGRNIISVCRGTACHTRGSRDLFETLMVNLGLRTTEDGQGEQLSVTTPDGRATLRTVACFGQCALAPVIEINSAIFGHMNERTLLRELDTLDTREPRK
jgi:NADH-quinone oxidoreductase subunit E